MKLFLWKFVLGVSQGLDFLDVVIIGVSVNIYINIKQSIYIYIEQSLSGTMRIFQSRLE